VDDEASIARYWVAHLRNWQPPRGEAELHHVETASIEGHPGVMLMWTQCGASYGLLVTVRDVLRQYGLPEGIQSGMQDLQMAVFEPLPRPHGRTERTWFRRMP
jgi:hypothetical protein